MRVVLVLVLAAIQLAQAFKPQGHVLRTRLWSEAPRQSRKERQAAAATGPAVLPPRFVEGENIPAEIKEQSVIYDMILVERINAPEQTTTGLFLPKVEGKDKKQLGKVLSVPTTYGLESEQGRVQPPSELFGDIVPGDVVFLRDAWGIGPKDQEVGERKFSFHKAAQITGVIRK